ncbi:MAG: transporter [Blastocatellia bacterium]|nr:transporter [Blastocatellia bacterium]
MGRKRTRRLLTLFLFISGGAISISELRAQTIVAPSARTLFNRATLIRSTVEVKRSSLQVDGKSINVTQYVPSLAIVYGFYPKWTVIVAQPYAAVNMTSRMGDEIRRENSKGRLFSSSGLADTQLFVQYDGLYNRNSPGGLTRLSGVFGIQVPTGARQFSTASASYTGGLIFEKAVRLKYVFTGDFQYTVATENDRGMSTGDRAKFDASAAYFVIPRDQTPPGASWLRKAFDKAFRNGTYLVLELNGDWQARARNRKVDIADTGGTTVKISPGIQYFPSNRFLIEFSAPVPVVKALNGVQPEPESAFVFGFRVLL